MLYVLSQALRESTVATVQSSTHCDASKTTLPHQTIETTPEQLGTSSAFLAIDTAFPTQQNHFGAILRCQAKIIQEASSQQHTDSSILPQRLDQLSAHMRMLLLNLQNGQVHVKWHFWKHSTERFHVAPS